MKAGDNVEFRVYGEYKKFKGVIENTLFGSFCIRAEDGSVYELGVIEMIRVCPGKYSRAKYRFCIPESVIVWPSLVGKA